MGSSEGATFRKPAQTFDKTNLTDATVMGAYREFITALQSRVGALKREGRTDTEAAMLATNEFTPKYPGWAQPIRIQAAARAMYKESN